MKMTTALVALLTCGAPFAHYGQTTASVTEHAPKNDTALARTHYDQAMLFLGKNTDSLTFYLEKAFDIAEYANIDPKLRGSMNYAMSRSLIEQGKYATAITYTSQAIGIFTALGQQKLLGRSYNQLGNSYNFLDRYEEAVQALEMAISIGKTALDTPVQISALINLGTTFGRLNEIDRAITYLVRADSLAAKTNQLALKAQIGMNLGISYQKQKDYSNALGYFLKAIQLARLAQDKQLLTNLYSLIAIVYTKQANYAKAEETCRLSMATYQELKDAAGLAQARASLLYVYEQTKQYKKAIAVAEEMSASTDLLVKADCMRKIGECYRKLGRFGKAREYKMRYKAIEARARPGNLPENIEQNSRRPRKTQQ